jgi:hypothetical protein
VDWPSVDALYVWARQDAGFSWQIGRGWAVDARGTGGEVLWSYAWPRSRDEPELLPGPYDREPAAYLRPELRAPPPPPEVSSPPDVQAFSTPCEWHCPPPPGGPVGRWAGSGGGGTSGGSRSACGVGQRLLLLLGRARLGGSGGGGGFGPGVLLLLLCCCCCQCRALAAIAQPSPRALAALAAMCAAQHSRPQGGGC